MDEKKQDLLMKISAYIDGEIDSSEKEELEKIILNEPEFKKYAEELKINSVLLKEKISRITDRVDSCEAWGSFQTKLAEAKSQETRSLIHKFTNFFKDLFLLKRISYGIAAYGFAAVLVGFVIILFRVLQPSISTECYVDRYSSESGIVVIDNDPDEDEEPVVIWHFNEEGIN
jgi:hypothetical protein